MKFIHQKANGKRVVLSEEEVHEHLSILQIQEAIEAKQADPLEEVSYMDVDGFIICEFDEEV